jgi:transcriptional regulator with XRE-family HTH domain
MTQGYSQPELARLLGVDIRTIRRWETGGGAPAIGPTIRSLASLFRVTPGFLLYGEEEE